MQSGHSVRGRGHGTRLSELTRGAGVGNDRAPRAERADPDQHLHDRRPGARHHLRAHECHQSGPWRVRYHRRVHAVVRAGDGRQLLDGPAARAIRGCGGRVRPGAIGRPVSLHPPDGDHPGYLGGQPDDPADPPDRFRIRAPAGVGPDRGIDRVPGHVIPCLPPAPDFIRGGNHRRGRLRLPKDPVRTGPARRDPESGHGRGAGHQHPPRLHNRVLRRRRHRCYRGGPDRPPDEGHCADGRQLPRPSFFVVIVGGAGSIAGVAAGSAVVGGLETLLNYQVPVTVSQAVVLVAAVVIVRFKPRGLIPA